MANNLVSHNLNERTTDTMEPIGNIEGATSADFIDGDARGGTAPDVGADEL